MSERTDIQIIRQPDGEPIFAVIPYDEYLRIVRRREPTIPHDVVDRHVRRGMALVRAWREHLGLSQKELASRAEMSPSQLAQIERSDKVLRAGTAERLAKALGLEAEQLTLVAEGGRRRRPVPAAATTIRRLVAQNPKKPGTKAFARFGLYRDGMTVGEALAAGIIHEDLRHDRDRGFIELVEIASKRPKTRRPADSEPS